MFFKNGLREYLTFYRIGFGIAVLGIVQFFVFVGLDWVGLVEMGNGIFPGVLMWLCWAVGGLVFGVGILIDFVKWIRRKRS